MKKLLILAAVALFLGVTAFAEHIPIQIGKDGPVIYVPNPLGGNTSGSYMLYGEVVGFSGDLITVRERQGEEKSILITPRTEIHTNLAAGDLISARVRSQNGILEAEQIEVTGDGGSEPYYGRTGRDYGYDRYRVPEEYRSRNFRHNHENYNRHGDDDYENENEQDEQEED